MRVLIATGIFPPQIGGPATYSKLLYDELPARGIDVEIATFGDYLDKPKIVRHFLYFRELLKKAADADIIYALDPVSVGLPALLASQVRDKKLVLRIAGDYAWEQGTQRFGVTDNLDDFARGYKKYPWQVKVLKKIEKYVSDGASSVIVPSEYLKRVVADWGVDQSKIKVVYNGFRVPVSRTLKASVKKRLNVLGPLIVTAGRLVPWKGMKALIEALPRVLGAIPEAKLAIIGDGPEENELRAKSKELGLDEHVIFTGRLEQRDLFDYVKAADVFALNTSYEGFSHQLIETMAIGIPIVTTAIGGNMEVIQDGKTGILLKPDDREGFARAMIELISEKAVAYVMATTAKKFVGKFTDEAMLENLSKHLRSI